MTSPFCSAHTIQDFASDAGMSHLQDSPNRRGVMGSKASGEPSLLLSVSILHALRAAVKAARQEVRLLANNHYLGIWDCW